MPRSQQRPEQYYWIGRDGTKIFMKDMSPDYLQRAHTHISIKELDLFNKLNNFNELKEQLEEIASLKGIKLKDPDQLTTTGAWGKYFCNRRSTKAIVPTLATKEKEEHNSSCITAMSNILE